MRSIKVGLGVLALLLSGLVATPAHSQTIGSLGLLGAGLNSTADYNLDNMFADAYKQARRPSKLSNTSLPATVDANGWPTEDFEQCVWSGVNKDTGTYKFSATLPGKPASPSFTTFGGNIANYAYNASTGVMTADLNFPAGQGSSDLFLKLANTNGGARDMKVIRPGYTSSDFFTSPFITLVNRGSTLRFMDWQNTNESPVTTWGERNTPASAIIDRRLDLKKFDGTPEISNSTPLSVSRGVPWEYCIKLANQLNKDVWVNVPHRATDDYVTKLAQLIRYGSDGTNPYTSAQGAPVWAPLNGGLKVYVEYSNETWNDQFRQSAYIRDYGTDYVSRGLNNGYTLNWDNQPAGSSLTFGERYAGVRTKQVSDIFKGVFGASAINNQVRVVLGSKVGQPNEFVAQRLSAIEQNFGAPKQYIWAVAVAPYFGYDDAFRTVLQTRNDLTATDWLNQMQNGENGIDNLVNPDRHGAQVIAKNLSLTLHYGINLVAYEGGPDLFLPGGATQSAKDSKIAALRDPRMKALTQQYLLNWYASGGNLFNYFVLGVGGFDYAVTEDYSVNSQKLQAFDATLTSAKPALIAGDPVPGNVPAAHSAGFTSRNDPTRPYIRAGWEENYIVRTTSAGNYSLKWTFDGNNASNSMKVTVNGTVISTGVAFPGTGSYGTFVDSPAVTIPLNAGLNNVRVTLIAGDTNIQTFKFNSVTGTGTGTGLKGEYFADKTLSTLVKSQTDPTVNFDWGNGSPLNTNGTPMTSVGPDNFSVRWSGQVQAISTGTYTFTTSTDDGVRLWLGSLTGTPAIDKWVDQGTTSYTTSFPMTSGQKYDLKMEYYDSTVSAVAKLFWTPPGGSSVTIPQAQLYPTLGTAPVSVPNSGFETPATTTYIYNPTGGSWTFGGNSGVQKNGSVWYASTAPQGTQTAFLQSNGPLGVITQSVSVPAGTHSVSFKLARRGGQVQPIKVSVGSTVLGTFTAPDSLFQAVTTATWNQATMGSVVLKFEATVTGGDDSSFLDDVRVN